MTATLSKVFLAGAGAIAMAVTVPASVPSRDARPAALCGEALTGSNVSRYAVYARVRPFLIWIGRRVVGGAEIGWQYGRGGSRRLDLLIGTDPDRTPMRVNRWGYIAETTCASRTDLIGVMTDADEQTIEEASRAQ